jgi:hypothetical protein
MVEERKSCQDQDFLFENLNKLLNFEISVKKGKLTPERIEEKFAPQGPTQGSWRLL